MPAKFVEHFPLMGFDDSIDPPWQMVPLAGTRTVKLKDAAGQTVRSSDPTVAKVSEVPLANNNNDRLVVIEGIKRGKATIESVGGGVVKAKLDVSVKNEKVVKVAFNFVQDKAGHKTARAHASVSGLVLGMNGILHTQANIKIKQHSVRDVKIDADLGTVVRWARGVANVAASEHEWDAVVAKRDGTADFNIFFVWEYEQDATPHQDNTNAGTLGGNCLCEDDVGGDDSQTLGHETGHHLGCPDRSGAGTASRLMYFAKAANAYRIPKEDNDVMNP